MNSKQQYSSILIAAVLLLSTASIGFSSQLANGASNFRILLTGDIGCGDNGKKTIAEMGKRDTPASTALWIGDLSYVDSSATCFINLVSGFGEKDWPVIGNHDDSEDGSSAVRTQILKHWELPSAGFYTKTIDAPGNSFSNDILLIGMDSQSSMKSGSTQFNFVKNALESNAAKEHPAPFILVMLHKPFQTCSGHHGPNGQLGTYHPLFKQYGVDIVAQGHNHNIQYFKIVDGTIYLVSGAGGRSHYDITSCPQPIAYKNTNSYGFTELNLDFDTGKLTGHFITNGGSVVAASEFGMTFDTSTTIPPEPPGEEICGDEIDNDGDGFVDEDCPLPPVEEVCGDGIDNDGDGQIDEDCTPPVGEEICGDEKDNDGDGEVDEGCVTPPTANETGFGEVKVIDVTASTFQEGTQNTPEKTIDGLLTTRWSADGNPQSISYQFNQSWVVSKVGVAFYKGTERTADFDVNSQFFKSNGETNNMQNFTLNNPVNTSSLTIVGHGNSDNDWNSLTEVKIYGSINGTATPPPEPPPECPVGTVWDPITQTCEELPPPPEPPGNATHFNVTIGAGIAKFIPDNNASPIFETEVENGTATLPRP